MSNGAVSASTDLSTGKPFQQRVAIWMLDCFSLEIGADRTERCDRFIEESLELVQSIGYNRERAHALVDYVFDRPIGDPKQEVGGVMVTLAALCCPVGIMMMDEGERELARISTPEMIKKIRKKQAGKPTGSALPMAHTDETESLRAQVGALKEALQQVRRGPTKPLPDPGVHSWRAFGEAAFRGLRDVQQIASKALAQLPANIVGSEED